MWNIRKSMQGIYVGNISSLYDHETWQNSKLFPIYGTWDLENFRAPPYIPHEFDLRYQFYDYD